MNFKIKQGKIREKTNNNVDVKNGSTGCGVFKGGLQNCRGFCLKINIHKGNYIFSELSKIGQHFRKQKMCSHIRILFDIGN